MSTLARNKQAKFNYAITKTFTAGIVLKGHEVKSLRTGQASLRDSFVRVENGEVWLINTHISLWKYANLSDYNPRTKRKLLLEKREIKELQAAQNIKKLSIIPLEIFVQGRRLKVKIGIGKGRKRYDKRVRIKEREMQKELRDEIGRVRKSNRDDY